MPYRYETCGPGISFFRSRQGKNLGPHWKDIRRQPMFFWSRPIITGSVPISSL
jgi:hypothetical protein